MTDRELLELAARAAGIEIDWQTPFVGLGDFAQFPHNSETGDQWNPLTDDGDALRLAVKIKWVPSRVEFEKLAINDDPYAATRRAIVRAAAAIGE